MVELQPSKLVVRVRSPSPAPKWSSTLFTVGSTIRFPIDPWPFCWLFCFYRGGVLDFIRGKTLYLALGDLVYPIRIGSSPWVVRCRHTYIFSSNASESKRLTFGVELFSWWKS